MHNFLSVTITVIFLFGIIALTVHLPKIEANADSGIEFHHNYYLMNGKCMDGFQHIVKIENGMDACVTPETFKRLVEINWGADMQKTPSIPTTSTNNTIIATESTNNNLLSVFTFTNDDVTIQTMKKYYGPNDYVIGTDPSFFSIFDQSRKVMFGSSLDDMKKSIADANSSPQKIDLITYDPEHWPLTPQQEQSDIPSAIKSAGDLVKGAGYRFGVTPDPTYLEQNYRQIDWTRVDYLNMQLQGTVSNNDDYSDFFNKVSTVTSFVKNANPNIEVFVQISFRFADADHIAKAIEKVKNVVDGFTIAYLPTGTPVVCKYCDIAGLDKVLSSIKTSSTPPPTTSSTPPPTTSSTFSPGMSISQLYTAIQSMTTKPKIAYVEPTYTSTAYSDILVRGHTPSFYDFYGKHMNDPLNTPISTDLNLLTQPVRTTLGNQSGLQTYNLLSSLNRANSLGVQISMLTDTDVHNGVIFDSQNHNLYNTLILAHQEYVTQQEYNNLKTFVNNGGDIIFVDGNALFVEVSYNSAQNTISLVLGHNFQYNGNYAMHVTTNDRYGYDNNNFIGGSGIKPQQYTLGYNPFSYTPGVMVEGQLGEDNSLRNSTGKVIIDYQPSIPAKIVSYEFDYGQGRVYHMGIFGDNVIGNSNYQQYLNYLIARSLNLTS